MTQLMLVLLRRSSTTSWPLLTWAPSSSVQPLSRDATAMLMLPVLP